MPRNRIFILWTHPLFRDVLGELLDHPEVECVGSSRSSDQTFDEIQELQPDIILFEEGVDLTKKAVCFFENAWHELQVIGLNLTDNHLHIYTKEHQMIRDIEELMEIILGGNRFRVL